MVIKKPRIKKASGIPAIKKIKAKQKSQKKALTTKVRGAGILNLLAGSKKGTQVTKSGTPKKPTARTKKGSGSSGGFKFPTIKISSKRVKPASLKVGSKQPRTFTFAQTATKRKKGK